MLAWLWYLEGASKGTRGGAAGCDCKLCPWRKRSLQQQWKTPVFQELRMARVVLVGKDKRGEARHVSNSRRGSLALTTLTFAQSPFLLCPLSFCGK